MTEQESSVKVIDFSPFIDGSDRQGVANALLSSFQSTGFVYLVNHGLPQEKIDLMFEWVSFFRHKPSARLTPYRPDAFSHCLWKAKCLHHTHHQAPIIEVCTEYDVGT